MTSAIIASALIMSAAASMAPKVGYHLPGFETCNQNSGDESCVIHLNDEGFIVDSSNGKPVFSKAEVQGALDESTLYRSGENLIIESSNSSASKNWSIVVFSYKNGIARATNYISLSKDTAINGISWVGQSCQGDVLLNKNSSIFSSAFDSLCEGKVNQGSTKVPEMLISSTANNGGLVVTIPNYEEKKKSWSQATYLFVSSDLPFAGTLLCLAGCSGNDHHRHLGGWIDRSLWIDLDMTQKNDAAIEGEYFYTKRQVKIPIKGILSGDDIDISEFGDVGDVSSGDFKGKRYGDSYVGIWKSNNRKYKFFLGTRLY